MYLTLGIHRRLSLAAACCILLALTSAGAARATVYGELSRFGEKGTGKGQFTEQGTAAIAFGVDPTDNSVYVGDEPSEHHFRVQKFSETGTFLGSVTFEVKGSGSEPESGIEGIAVDPVEHRVYVLAVQSRGTEEQVEVDPEVLAAGAIYAFSTEPVAEKLEPASGTGTGGLLAGSSVFKPQSKVLGEALLEPSGIAVDPTTHDIVVMAKEDRGASFEPERRYALERIKSTGVKGARYVDSAPAAFFEAAEEATSPAVSASGKVYVVGGELQNSQGEPVEEIDEIPSNFNSSEAPKPLTAFDPGQKELVTFPGVPKPNEGTALSIGADGKLYTFAKVRHEGTGEGFAPGVLIFNPDGSEFGWTGGQTVNRGPACAISFLGHPMVAAGKEGRVFVFDSNPQGPSVVALGPGGAGCPTASSGELSATLNGAPVSGAVSPESEINLSSTLAEGNALSVQWSFGDGTEAETVGQHQAPEITHKFVGEGELKVKETIHTDNLASPEFVEEKTIVVESPRPEARFSAPEAALVGEPVSFDGKTSTDPGGEALTYKWTFGDGSSEETSAAKVVHTYTVPGSYPVALTVSNGKGLKSAPVTHTVVVSAPGGGVPKEPPGEASKEAPREVPREAPKEQPKAPALTYEIKLSGSSLTVGPSGAVAVEIDCAGRSSCTGSVSVRTLGKVGAGKHKSALSLGGGALKLAGGRTGAIVLRLPGKARALLARLHILKARVTVVAHDAAGVAHTSQFTVVLRLAKRGRGHR
jgi:PKD repeat protein